MKHCECGTTLKIVKVPLIVERLPQLRYDLHCPSCGTQKEMTEEQIIQANRVLAEAFQVANGLMNKEDCKYAQWDK